MPADSGDQDHRELTVLGLGLPPGGLLISNLP